MKKLLTGLLFLLALPALAVDAAFVWDNPNAAGIVAGYELRWSAVQTDPKQFEQKKDIPGEAPARGEVTLSPGEYRIAVWAYSTTQNPDGTTVKLFSDPSNVLVVRIIHGPTTLRIGAP